MKPASAGFKYLSGSQWISVRLHPHAQVRLIERGATEEEVIATVENGTPFVAQYGRTRFRCNFPFNAEW